MINYILFNFTFYNNKLKYKINILVIKFVIKNNIIKNCFYSIIIYIIYLLWNFLFIYENI